MYIEIVAVSVEDKGKYKMMDAAYKGSDGKIASKKIMSFGAGADVFQVLTSAKQGDKFDVTTVKNDKGYWDWTSASTSSGLGAAQVSASPASTNTSSPKSTYETAEERANRQVLIVRQSSLSNSISFFALGKKSPSLSEVVEVAQAFEEYVFGKVSKPSIHDLESDVI